MELGFRLEGDWKGALKQLAWLRQNWGAVLQVVVRRAVLSLAEETGLAPQSYVFVRVHRANDLVSYGVAVEPTLEEIKLSSLRDKVVLLELEHTASDDLQRLRAQGPWLGQSLPDLPEKGEGHLVVRDASHEERQEVLRRNQRWLSDHVLLMSAAQRSLLSALRVDDDSRPMLLAGESRVWAAQDAAYNLARAEFGLGDEISRMVWRPALLRLLNQRLEPIFEDVIDDYLKGDLDLKFEMDTFEERKETWLSSSRSFALMFHQEDVEL